ncbi:MAG: type II toxin-antitoxin system VapC family toxin [Chloroflexia bacterium]|nr:type II toxin-antitoxin system VapC family toxin [Chloroflexia bacterium]
MILYLDSSALVKLYFHEKRRGMVTMAVEESEGMTTSTITYAETRATLSRKHREGWLDNNGLEQAVADLNNGWLTFARIDVVTRLTYRAGHLARMNALRGFDAVHLARAVHLTKEYNDLSFLAFDMRLNDAARAAALTIYGDVSDAG